MKTTVLISMDFENIDHVLAGLRNYPRGTPRLLNRILLRTSRAYSRWFSRRILTLNPLVLHR